MEMSFIDQYEGAKTSMKIDEEESTKDKMVYYATFKYFDNGKGQDFRYTLSASGDAIIVKKEVKLNGEYTPGETFEFTSNSDKIVSQKQIMPDGSKKAIYTYKPNSLTSLIQVSNVGHENLLDNISIVQK